MISSSRIRPAWLIAAGVLAGILLAVGAMALLDGDSGGSTGDAAPNIVQPAAPGEAGSELSADELEDIEPPSYTDADVRFMQDMIPHHQQGLDMTDLVAERSDSRDIALLAGRIAITQKSEIGLMEDWLTGRGEQPSTEGSHDAAQGHDEMSHHGSGAMSHEMPGMLTAAQFARLSAARGGEFDRLFCDLMIQHHRGALAMVDQQRAAGGGIESEGYTVAAEIEADQRIEIKRMREVLREIGKQ